MSTASYNGPLSNSDGLQPASDCLQPSSDGLKPNSDGLPNSRGLQLAIDGLHPTPKWSNPKRPNKLLGTSASLLATSA